MSTILKERERVYEQLCQWIDDDPRRLVIWVSRISQGFALRGLPNPGILWHSVTLPLNVARIAKSEPSTTRNPEEPANLADLTVAIPLSRSLQSPDLAENIIRDVQDQSIAQMLRRFYKNEAITWETFCWPILKQR